MHPASARAFAARRNLPRRTRILLSKLSRRAILYETRISPHQAGHFTSFPPECKQVKQNIIDEMLFSIAFARDKGGLPPLASLAGW